MDTRDLDQRLSRISTQWTLVLQAHNAPAGGPQSVLQGLLQRYSGAALRYLMGAVRDLDVAEELAQEFALRFVRGDFRRADPERGRFRDYLKTSLIHLATDYQRLKAAQPARLGVEPAAPAQVSLDSEQDFLRSWREELVERTWKALADANPAYHAALRFRIDNPEVPSAQMAEQLEATLGKAVSAASARKLLERAHGKFADLLLEEVAFSLEEPSAEALREELTELDLLKYCRSALERYRA
jgi:DNA-directed RNA polymerase specialized sigma24 family protein